MLRSRSFLLKWNKTKLWSCASRDTVNFLTKNDCISLLSVRKAIPSPNSLNIIGGLIAGASILSACIASALVADQAECAVTHKPIPKYKHVFTATGAINHLNDLMRNDDEYTKKYVADVLHKIFVFITKSPENCSEFIALGGYQKTLKYLNTCLYTPNDLWNNIIISSLRILNKILSNHAKVVKKNEINATILVLYAILNNRYYKHTAEVVNIACESVALLFPIVPYDFEHVNYVTTLVHLLANHNKNNKAKDSEAVVASILSALNSFIQFETIGIQSESVMHGENSIKYDTKTVCSCGVPLTGTGNKDPLTTTSGDRVPLVLTENEAKITIESATERTTSESNSSNLTSKRDSGDSINPTLLHNNTTESIEFLYKSDFPTLLFTTIQLHKDNAAVLLPLLKCLFCYISAGNTQYVQQVRANSKLMAELKLLQQVNISGNDQKVVVNQKDDEEQVFNLLNVVMNVLNT